ncbi:MAG: phosphatase PAP2 family protein [Sarcina sp.]
MEFIKNMDSSTLYFMQNHIQNPYLNPIMVFITNLGDMGFIWILISVILLFIKKFRIVGILMLCSLALNTILGEGLLKNLIQRPRPFNTLPGLHLLITAPQSFSFPSGHTSSAFACAIILGYYIRKSLIPSLILAFLIGFSRVYLTVHYPSDVLAGMLLGIFSAFITIYVYEKKIKKIKTRN